MANFLIPMVYVNCFASFKAYNQQRPVLPVKRINRVNLVIH